MTRLANDLIRQIAGRGPVPADFRAQLGELKRHYGTVTAASKALGIDRRTFQRWESGAIRTPKPERREGVERAVRQARVDQAAVSTAQLKVNWKYDGRTRPLTTNNLQIQAGTIDAMKDAYVRGDTEGVARSFIDGITDPWYFDQLDATYAAGVAASGEGSDATGEFV